jgi:type VI secretion system protein ImpH
VTEETIIVRRPAPLPAAGPPQPPAEKGDAAAPAGPLGDGAPQAGPAAGAPAESGASPAGGALLEAALEATESAAAEQVAAARAAAPGGPPVPDEPGDPPPSPALRPLAPVQRLAREPTRFVLDQAVDVAARVAGSDPLELRYRSWPRLGLPAGEVVQARPETGELTVAAFGLIGPGGVLPRHITATVGAELRKRSTALHAFLDMNARRFVGLYAKAGAKYRPTRNPEPAETVLAAAIGMATPGLEGRIAPPMPALLYHAGNLAARTRSAERLRAMLEEEIGGRVDIVEFAGGWVRLPEEEQTRLGGGRAGQHGALGQGAAAGSQVWDPQARFVIRIGPLRRAAFEALLPGTPRHRTLVDLTRLFVGLDVGFALNLVLAKEEIPPLSLGGGVARLGQTSWLGSVAPRPRDGTEPMFDAR